MNDVELQLLEISLWTFCFTFVVKCLVFGFLGWMMRGGGHDVFGLDPAMRRHYWSLSLQAFILTILYFHYAMQITHESPIPFGARVFVYVAGVLSVLFAAWFGVALLYTYRYAHDRLAQMGGEIALLTRKIEEIDHLEAEGASR